MKIQSKILLLKSRASDQMACSAVTSAGIFYWRPITSTEAINATMQSESFHLVVLDHRATRTDAITAIASLRKYQPHAKVILVSDPLEIHQVVQAMRIGVREVFPPPLDMQGMVECIESHLDTDWSKADLDRWSVLIEFLELGRRESPAEANPPPTKYSHPRAGHVPVRDPVRESDDLVQAQPQIQELTAECKRLSQEVARLTAVEKHARSLEKEIEAACQQSGSLNHDNLRAADMERIRQAEARIEALDATLTAERAALARLKAELEARSARLSEVEKSLGESQQSLAASEKRASQAIAEKDAFKRQVDDRRAATTKEVAALTQEKANLLTELARLQEQDEARTAEMNATSQKIGTLEQQIVVLAEVAQQLEATESKIEELKQANESLTFEKQSFAERDASRASLEEKLRAESRRVIELARELQAVRAEAGRAILDAEEKLEAERAAIAHERASIAGRESALASERGEHEAMCKQLEEHLNQREASLAARGTELETRLRTETETLAGERASLQQMRETLADERERLEISLKELDAGRAELAHRVAQFEQRRDELAEEMKRFLAAC